VLLLFFYGGHSESEPSATFQWLGPKLGMVSDSAVTAHPVLLSADPVSELLCLARLFLTQSPTDRFLGAALGKGAYALTAAAVTGIYMIVTHNAICPFGCCCCGRERGGRRGGEYGSRRQPSELDLLGLVDHLLDGDDGHTAINPSQKTQNPLGTGSHGHRASGLLLVAALAIPSMLSMIAEWWAAEFRQLLAGWLPHNRDQSPSPHTGPATAASGSSGGDLDDLGAADGVGIDVIMAANGVLFVLTVVWYQAPKGLGIAAGIRTGNALGAGLPLQAKDAAWLGVRANAILGLVSAIGYYLLTVTAERPIFAQAFTSNRHVVDLVAQTALPTALSMFGFAMMMTSIQLLNSVGRNSQGTVLAFISCWVVGVASSAVFAFTPLMENAGKCLYSVASRHTALPFWRTRNTLLLC
jgi:hypothetical protein